MKMSELYLLEEKMIAIAHNYFLACRYLKNPSNISDDNSTLLCCYISKVKKAFQHLNEDEQSFINNEYFYEAPPYWWKKNYTLQTYNQIKQTAIEHFLEVFHVHY